MARTLKIYGVKAWKRNLEAAGKQIIRGTGNAVESTGDKILNASNQIVPVNTGALAESGKVVKQGNDSIVEYDTEYAAIVHEDMEAQHGNGRQAKFLQKASDNAQTFLNSSLGKIK